MLVNKLFKKTFNVHCSSFDFSIIAIFAFNEAFIKLSQRAVLVSSHSVIEETIAAIVGILIIIIT